jgi:hypothetical protein
MTLLTGCLTATVALEVDDSGSGQIAIEVYPSDLYRKRLKDVDLERLERASRSSGADVEISEIGTVGNRGYRIEVHFDDYRVLTTAGEGGVRLGGQDVRLFAAFGLIEKDGGWTLLAEMNPLGEVLAPVAMLFGLPAVDSTPKVDLSVTLPGRVIRSNSTTQEGGTATWNLDFSTPVNPGTAPTPLEMQTEPVPLITPAQWAIIAGVLVVVLGIAFIALGGAAVSRRRPRRRRRRKARGGDSGWAKAPVDAPRSDQSVVAPPLPWQTYRPGDPSTPVPPAPTAPVAAPVDERPPPTEGAAPAVGPTAGWYPDPTEPDVLRWWDGEAWSESTSRPE